MSDRTNARTNATNARNGKPSKAMRNAMRNARKSRAHGDNAAFRDWQAVAKFAANASGDATAEIWGTDATATD